jgi:hypothetical protein
MLHLLLRIPHNWNVPIFAAKRKRAIGSRHRAAVHGKAQAAQVYAVAYDVG